MKIRYAATAALLVAGFVVLARPMVDASPFSYDEADYMYAAGRGFASNYLERPAQSFGEFLHTGLSRGRDASQKSALSQAIRDSGDIDFYRHWHGPLYFYWLILLQPFRSNEHTVRAISMLFPALTILVIYFGALRWGSYAAFLAAALYGWSVISAGSTELAPHELFVLVCVIGLFALAEFIACGERKYWYCAVVCAALAVATLEVGLIMVLTLAVFGYRQPRRVARNSVLLFLGSLVAVWPGAFLKLAVIKAYIFMAYLAVMRKAAWGATFSQAWTARLLLAPVEWVLFAAAVVLYFRARTARDRRAAPFLIFGILMLVFLGRVNAAGARYMLPFLPVMDIFAAIIVMNSLKRGRAVLVCTACAALVANTLRIEFARLHNVPDTRNAELIAQVRARNLTDKKILAPHEDFPLLHYYFPGARIVAYGENSEGPPAGVQADATIDPGYPVRIK